LGLTEAIFGVDKHFDQLFSEIGEYTTLLEEKGAPMSLTKILSAGLNLPMASAACVIKAIVTLITAAVKIGR
jgi:hypothetical protein